MKRNLSERIILLFILLFVSFCAFADQATTIVSSPAATVNLIRNHAITNSDLDQEVQNYADNGINMSREQVLDIMINDEVFLQGAARDGISVSDMQLDQQIQAIRTEVNRSFPTPLTDEQFEAIIAQQTGISYADYREALRNQMLIQLYVMQEKGEEIRNANITPSTKDIEDFYRKNRQNFYSPESVKLAHIYIPFVTASDSVTEEDAASQNAANAELMIDVAARIKSGEISFEKAVQDYSQDDGSKNIGGDIGWLRIDNEQARQGFGDDFFYAVMAMQPGDVSPMLESNVGYHIVKVSVHTEGKLLGIDDYLNPESTVTVREYISNVLSSQNQQTAFQQALDELITELRGQARIRVYV